MDQSTNNRNERVKKETIRYCHFYNRNKGCTRVNCQFTHDVAPPCNDYLHGRCRRRFCGYSHAPVKHTEDDDSPNENTSQQNFQSRRPLHPGEKTFRSHNQQTQLKQSLDHWYRNTEVSITKEGRIVTIQKKKQTINNQQAHDASTATPAQTYYQRNHQLNRTMKQQRQNQQQ